MRAMLSLNVVMNHDDGGETALACCDVVVKSIHNLAVAKSSRPSKKSKMASRVSAMQLAQVWLTNHVACPTCFCVSRAAFSSLARPLQLRDVRGLMNIWQNWDVVMRLRAGASMERSHEMYGTSTPCADRELKITSARAVKSYQKAKVA